MTDDILLTIGEDGKASLYDDTYDITIHCESKEEQDEVRKALENIPHWIPVTERLPERDELVLVTYKTTDKIHLCKYLDDGSENPWWSYIDDCCTWNNVILAWMPLPEPAKLEND